MACDGIILKEECTETLDVMTMRPIDGKVLMYEQGKGLTRSMVSVTGKIRGSSGNMFGDTCSGAVEIGVTETAYAGTPYIISTIRGLE